MNESPPMERKARPASACLDGEETRAAARGSDDPGIREHLSRCADCRRAAQELRRELRHTGSHSQRWRPASMGARPAVWLVLLALAVVAVGVVLLVRRAEEPKQMTLEPVAEPVTAPADVPAERRRVRRVRPRPGGPSIDAEIVATIRRNQSGVRICYERALKRDDDLTLRIDVHVGVTSAGVVEDVSIDGAPGARPLSDCIRNVIKTWQFPRAPEAYRSTFPLRLQRGQ
jgi:hypothetical protein